MPETASTATKYLRNLWNEAEAARLAANPLELLRYRSNLLGADLRITNFGGGNTSSKFDAARSADRRAGARAGGEGQRRRSAIDRHFRLCHPVSRQARTADRALSRRSARRRDGRLLSAVRVRREPVAASIDTPCTRSCRSTTSIIFIPTGATPIWSCRRFRVTLALADAGWSSSVARRAHNPEVAGSNPAPATTQHCDCSVQRKALQVRLGGFRHLVDSRTAVGWRREIYRCLATSRDRNACSRRRAPWSWCAFWQPGQSWPLATGQGLQRLSARSPAPCPRRSRRRGHARRRWQRRLQTSTARPSAPAAAPSPHATSHRSPSSRRHASKPCWGTCC